MDRNLTKGQGDTGVEDEDVCGSEPDLLEGLLVLPVLEGVDEGVDGGGHPGQHRGDDVDGWEGHLGVGEGWTDGLTLLISTCPFYPSTSSAN